MMRDTTHSEATDLDGGDKIGGAPPTVAATADMARQLAARRDAAARLAPLDDGRRDPDMDGVRLLEVTGPCSRYFACTAQNLDMLQRVHHCPCDEAQKAGVA